MQTKRHRDERGRTYTGWLDSSHSFSFGHYQDPKHMGFGDLRVINDDRVIPGAGFGSHGHSDMEIISYVLEGELAHKDDMGNGSSIRHGDVQIMSAASGVVHSEFNGSDEHPVHFLQMWVMPNVQGGKANYQERSFDALMLDNQFCVVVSPDGADGSLIIRQNARLLIGRLHEGSTHNLKLYPKRRTWVQIASGRAEVNGEEASAGDGFALFDESKLHINSVTQSEILMFDLP